jgi:hypothetical protein
MLKTCIEKRVVLEGWTARSLNEVGHKTALAAAAGADHAAPGRSEAAYASGHATLQIAQPPIRPIRNAFISGRICASYVRAQRRPEMAVRGSDLLGGIRWAIYTGNHHRFKDCRFPVGCQRHELEVGAIGSELFLTREADKMYLKRDIRRILLPRANHLFN